ncbi:hypothetical protein SCHPADRAFT_841218 [Schizopora paradoxa]|uniref:Uncharacterized protein n=1 Tax=Schizopora paradoxa TaxID=27342 RepID=A0A0H2QWK4_9AGAM|nr:hypothetical protein SCHPADRAFT_841218 [Schizopora paradoxa]
MRLAMGSVKIETIRRWEHHTRRWMDVYGVGLGAKAAQMHVKRFSAAPLIDAFLSPSLLCLTRNYYIR